MDNTKNTVTRIRTSFILTLSISGTAAIAAAIGAELFGLDITPGFGLIQMSALLIGLTLLTIAGYVQIYLLRKADEPRSLQADIGIRLGATGLVLSYFVGWSDLLGVGTHITPLFDRPFVGPLQLVGLGISVLLIVIGLLLYFTSRGNQQASSLEFLIEP